MSAALNDALERSRSLGFLGPGPIDSHIAHAQPLVDVLRRHWPQGELRGLDLGSGGGVPGLILAGALPHSHWSLLDAMERRTAFLAGALRTMALHERAEVVHERAEVAGRDPKLRGQHDVVVARSFAAAPITAECAAPFLRVGGLLIVSEPPDADPSRWDAAGMGRLGFDAEPVEPQPWIAFRLIGPCPDEFPRPVGRPAKRPLWRPTERST